MKKREKVVGVFFLAYVAACGGFLVEEGIQRLGWRAMAGFALLSLGALTLATVLLLAWILFWPHPEPQVEGPGS